MASIDITWSSEVFSMGLKKYLKPSRISLRNKISLASNGLQMLLRRTSDDGFRNPWELSGSFSPNDPDLLKQLEIGF